MFSFCIESETGLYLFFTTGSTPLCLSYIPCVSRRDVVHLSHSVQEAYSTFSTSCRVFTLGHVADSSSEHVKCSPSGSYASAQLWLININAYYYTNPKPVCFHLCLNVLPCACDQMLFFPSTSAQGDDFVFEDFARLRLTETKNDEDEDDLLG